MLFLFRESYAKCKRESTNGEMINMLSEFTEVAQEFDRNLEREYYV